MAGNISLGPLVIRTNSRLLCPVGKGAISVAFVCPSVDPSVAYIANNSRTQTPSVAKFGRNVASPPPLGPSTASSSGFLISRRRSATDPRIGFLPLTGLHGLPSGPLLLKEHESVGSGVRSKAAGLEAISTTYRLHRLRTSQGRRVT